jgi:hypothetical protein
MAQQRFIEIDTTPTRQTPEVDSFFGGSPRVPSDFEMPACRLCGCGQTFMFQVAFPEDHPWTGLSLGVFACTSCVNESFLIPEMLPGPLRNADIPAGFLESYQRNFSFAAFPTPIGTIRLNYPVKVAFRRLLIKPTPSKDTIGRLGGRPDWLLEDESPATYEGRSSMTFLLQLTDGIQFVFVPGAPGQVELGLDGRPQQSPYRFYQLFNGNALFLFGTAQPDKPLVYAITQR